MSNMTNLTNLLDKILALLGSNKIDPLYGVQLHQVVERLQELSCFHEISGDLVETGQFPKFFYEISGDLVETVLNLLKKKITTEGTTREQMEYDTSCVTVFFWQCFWYYQDSGLITQSFPTDLPELDIDGLVIRAKSKWEMESADSKTTVG